MRYKTIIKGLGMWRSLVAHLAWDEGVARSNRVIPTILIKDFQKFWKSFLMPLCNRRLKVHSLHILKLWTINKNMVSPKKLMPIIIQISNWQIPYQVRNDVDYVLDCFKIKDFSQWQIKLTDITISLQSLNETMKKLVLSEW